MKQLLKRLMHYWRFWKKRTTKESSRSSSAGDNSTSFFNLFSAYLQGDYKCVLQKNPTNEIIVSVQGLFFSGSGAVVDLLREYDSTSVFGGIDIGSSMSDIDQAVDEINLLRLAGGLFEVEKYIGSYNIFQNDALLHRVIMQLENSEIYQKRNDLRPIFYEFLSGFCYMFSTMPNYQYFNSYLDYKGNNAILFLKDISVDEYRNLCKSFLNTLFAQLNKQSLKQILVLDQLTADFEFTPSLYESYISNLKTVVVYRDPRDVYVFAIKNEIEFIPHGDVNEFIYWFKAITRSFDINEKEKYHSVQFEKLITNYDYVVKNIEQYVGLKSIEHSRLMQCFNPAVSINNIGLWRNNSEYIDDCREIFSELGKFCFE